MVDILKGIRHFNGDSYLLYWFPETGWAEWKINMSQNYFFQKKKEKNHWKKILAHSVGLQCYKNLNVEWLIELLTFLHPHAHARMTFIISARMDLYLNWMSIHISLFPFICVSLQQLSMQCFRAELLDMYYFYWLG